MLDRKSKFRKGDIPAIIFVTLLLVGVPSIFFYFYVVYDGTFLEAAIMTFLGGAALLLLPDLLGLVVYPVSKVIGFFKDKKKSCNECVKPKAVSHSQGMGFLIKKDLSETDRFTLMAVGGVFIAMLSAFMVLYFVNEQAFESSFKISLSVGMVLLGMGVILKVVKYFILAALGFIRRGIKK